MMVNMLFFNKFFEIISSKCSSSVGLVTRLGLPKYSCNIFRFAIVSCAVVVCIGNNQTYFEKASTITNYNFYSRMVADQEDPNEMSLVEHST